MQQNIPTMVKIRSRSQETRDLFTIYLDFMDSRIASEYTFTPGQFNMLYLPGIGEVAISTDSTGSLAAAAMSSMLSPVSKS